MNYLTDWVKGAVCNIYGDLLTEMDYHAYNYVVSVSPYETSRLDFAFLFTYTSVRSTQRLTRNDTTCLAILITVA